MILNEEVPDNLGGLGDMLPADVLKVINELLEQLHRKDKDHQGSHNTIIYVAPGAQYVGTIEKQYVQSAPMKSQPNLLRGVGEELPEVLSTPEAMMLWEKAQRAGYVDGRYQPLEHVQRLILCPQSKTVIGVSGQTESHLVISDSKQVIPSIYPWYMGGRNICLGLFYLIMLIAAIFLMKTFVTIVILCNFGVEFRICIRYG